MGFSQAEIARRLPDIEGFANIGEFFDQPMKVLSSGMFLRVAFAAAVNIDPEILIIDEALAVGDVRFMVRCVERLLEMQRAGVTVLLVSHVPDIIDRLCDRAILMEGGEIVGDGRSVEMADRYFAMLFSEGVPAAADVIRPPRAHDQPARGQCPFAGR